MESYFTRSVKVIKMYAHELINFELKTILMVDNLLQELFLLMNEKKTQDVAADFLLIKTSVAKSSIRKVRWFQSIRV
jgi:hypothetical protein